MIQNMLQNTVKLFTVILFTFTLFISSAYAENIDERDKSFAEAFELFLKGEYEKSIKIFDEMLEIYPEDYKIFEMKGVGLSNLRLESTLAMQPQQNMVQRDPSNLNKSSMFEFYKALEINPNSVLALNGMGLGFGNFGEYSEAETYFKKSLEINPGNKVTQNYLTSLENLKKKYSLDVFENPTKKPDFLKMMEENTIPSWIKHNAGWWADNKINDKDFISGIEYLLENKIIKVSTYVNKENSTDGIPSWIKNNAGWWSSGKISDNDFLTGIEYLIENGIINVNAKTNSELLEKDLERKAWNFERYLTNIQSDIKKQNRYVENINPSEYVIIKYWKNYHKWNLESYLDRSEIFPDRKVSIDPETGNYIIDYLIYINEQPDGLPIDHVSTLENSFSIWETTELSNSDDGKKVSVRFYTTDMKGEANVWITWVVRSMGEGVLGHANLGKGVVEVAIGGYGCDGSFQLFDINTVEYIMTHELGHSLGFGHSNNSEKIMYPSIPYSDYAYCLLN
jgi:tetratricopeptide (TPR) repeat protein